MMWLRSWTTSLSVEGRHVIDGIEYALELLGGVVRVDAHIFCAQVCSVEVEAS